MRSPLRRLPAGDALHPDVVRRWQISWSDHLPGTADEWLTRLTAALPRVLGATP